MRNIILGDAPKALPSTTTGAAWTRLSQLCRSKSRSRLAGASLGGLIIAMSMLACDASGNLGANPDGDEACAAGTLRDGLGECREPCHEGVCGAGWVCLTQVGLCLPETEVTCSAQSCPAGFVCPAEGGACVPIDGYCESNFDCPVGQRCEGDSCVSRVGDVVQTCATDGDCGPLMNCQFGVCTGCLADIQCGPGGACVFGTCVKTGEGAVPACLLHGCADGTQCNAVNGECEHVCQSSDDCGPGGTCVPAINRCVAEFGCESGSDCQAGLECLPGVNLCFGCADETDCQPSEFCFLQACLPRLEQGVDLCADNECHPDNELCDALDGSCYPADGTCSSADDCRDGFSCNFLGLCTGCVGDGDCRQGQRCILTACVPLE